MKHNSLCPVCGDEALHETHRKVPREMDGFKREVPFHASICSSCGCETLTEKQATFNRRQMTDFYREADGLLTGCQIKAFRVGMGLTQVQAAKIFGGGKNAFSKYENGDVTQSAAMDKLIRTAYSVPAALDFLNNGCPKVVTINYFSSSYHNLYKQLISKSYVKIANPMLNKAKPGNIELLSFNLDQESNKAQWEISPIF